MFDVVYVTESNYSIFNSKVKLANKDIRIQQKSCLDLTLGRCKLCAGFSPVKTQQQSQEFI